MSTEPTLPNSLQPPPIAKGNPKAVEVLRVRTASQQLFERPMYPNS
jgi:hypothetical protein